MSSPTNWSPVDSRDYATFPNEGVVQPSGAVFYDAAQVDSRVAGAPVDSRVNKPVDSRVSPPINSRVDPNA